MKLIQRIGLFLFLMGAAFLALFFSSDFARTPDPSMFFLSIFCLAGGVYLLRISRQPAQKAERFRMLNKIRGRGGNNGSSPQNEDYMSNTDDF